MKRIKHKPLLLAVVFMAFQAFVSPSISVAQEELDIEALRKELQESHTGAANKDTDTPAPKSGAVAKAKGDAIEDESQFLNGDDDFKPAITQPVKAIPAKAKTLEKSQELDAEPVLIKNENAAYLTDENRSLKNQVTDFKKKLSDKSDELEKVRNRLVIAETQVERLSDIIEKRNAQTLQNAGIQPAASNQMRASLPAPQQSQPQQQRAAPPASNQDNGEMLVATVVANKANLRTGPGVDNSPLMTVNKGTRLAVETREGTWYRVMAPNGSRAWVTGDVLNFESQGNVRVGGYVAPKRQNF